MTNSEAKIAQVSLYDTDFQLWLDQTMVQLRSHDFSNLDLDNVSLMRMPGTWEDYCALRDSRGDGSIPRIKFRNGEILLMSPLPRHGRGAHLLARVVEALLDSETRNYEAFTPITMDIPESGGIEPD